MASLNFFGGALLKRLPPYAGYTDCSGIVCQTDFNLFPRDSVTEVLLDSHRVAVLSSGTLSAKQKDRYLYQGDTIMKKLVIAAAVGMLASTNIFASDIQDLSALARNVVPDTISPGLEAIAPVFINIDSDSDGVPNKLKIQFNVYSGGTNTLLHKSTAKYIEYPPIPCANPANIEPDFETKFLGRSDSPRTHVGMILTMGCWDQSDNQWKESASKTFIYSADVSQAGGTVWAKAYNNQELIGFNGLDIDGDGKSDTLMISLLPDTDELPADMTVILLNPTDGTVISQNKYPVLR